MLKQVLLASSMAAALEFENGDPCLGYDTCKSGCCLRNILPELGPDSWFYPDKYDPPK